jgi:hypothetical protein
MTAKEYCEVTNALKCLGDNSRMLYKILLEVVDGKTAEEIKANKDNKKYINQKLNECKEANDDIGRLIWYICLSRVRAIEKSKYHRQNHFVTEHY